MKTVAVTIVIDLINILFLPENEAVDSSNDLVRQ